MATYTPGYSYASNPSPQGGSGTFGAVPGVISMPNPSADLANQIPNLGEIIASVEIEEREDMIAATPKIQIEVNVGDSAVLTKPQATEGENKDNIAV